jgi:two-component system sensor histidine kinase TtrS
MMQTLRLLLILSISLFCLVCSAADRPAVRLGIMSFTDAEGRYTTHIRNEDTVISSIPQFLQEKIPDIEFRVTYYRMNELMTAISSGEVDLFMASSGLFWQMKHKGVRDLATIASKQTPNPNKGVAGVIFARKDRTELNTLEDIRGLTASTGLPNMFLAAQLALSSVAQGGYDPDRFFARILWHDLPIPTVLEEVRNGTADVGLIRACVLESEAPDWKNEFRIINAQPEEDFHCARSTDAFPNWTIAATDGFSPELSRRVAVALLSSPPSEKGGYHWSLATDFEKVDRVSRLLKTDGYSYLKEWTLARIWKQYQEWILVILALIASLIIHLLRVEDLVKKRTSAWKEEMDRRRQAEELARDYEKRMAAAQKMSILGQLSSIFAHELRQPLQIVQYLNDGIRLLIRRDSVNIGRVAQCSDGIEAQLTKMSEILARVRSYAKSGQKRDEKVNLSELTRTTLQRLLPSDGAVTLKSAVADGICIRGDALELELLINNLVKNALEEMQGAKGRLEVALTREAGRVLLQIDNSGRKFSKEDILRFSQPLETSKSGGLGLGISIAQSIAEAHRGHLTLEARDGGGVRASVEFPENQEP